MLAERGTIQDLRNPAGFLMRTLCNLIASAHRQAYKRRTLISEGTTDESALGTSPDIADSYEAAERNQLVKAAIRDIPCPRHRRILALFSQGDKPSEIARKETASGYSTTSHQVSCALIEARRSLGIQLRRYGVLPTLLAGVVLRRLRLRLRALSSRTSSALRGDAVVLSQVTLTSLVTVLALSLPNGSPPPSTEQFEPLPTRSVHDYEMSRPEPGRNPPSHAELPGAAPGTWQSSSRSVGSLEIGGFHHETTERTERNELDSPPLQDQVLSMIRDPGAIPLPECGGLAVCPPA